MFRDSSDNSKESQLEENVLFVGTVQEENEEDEDLEALTPRSRMKKGLNFFTNELYYFITM